MEVIGEPGSRRLLFFFSSRRRHTRFSRDWSSDVCSSDLSPRLPIPPPGPGFPPPPQRLVARACEIHTLPAPGLPQPWPGRCGGPYKTDNEIGRASCRERVSARTVAVARKKKEERTTHRR